MIGQRRRVSVGFYDGKASRATEELFQTRRKRRQKHLLRVRKKLRAVQKPAWEIAAEFWRIVIHKHRKTSCRWYFIQPALPGFRSGHTTSGALWKVQFAKENSGLWMWSSNIERLLYFIRYKSWSRFQEKSTTSLFCLKIFSVHRNDEGSLRSLADCFKTNRPSTNI